jgi:hypothetical protein
LLLRFFANGILFTGPAQMPVEPGVGRAAGTAHPREHQILEKTMMLSEILSAITFAVYFVVPQILWAIRRGQ